MIELTNLAGEKVDDTPLIMNAVRMAIRACRETEESIRRDYAHEKVWGSPAAAEREMELLHVASESTLEYTRLLRRLEDA